MIRLTGRPGESTLFFSVRGSLRSAWTFLLVLASVVFSYKVPNLD